MKMKRTTYRQIGAVSGLVSGWGAMFCLDYAGVVPAAIFGVIGCVLGAVTGEQIHDRV